MAAPITFYFDFISPYAFVAWTQIHRIANEHGVRVDPKPILFAALLDAYGHKGPAEIPPKRIYTFKDAFRKAHRYGLPPLVPPPSHPFLPLLALRVAATIEDELARRAACDALFAATWLRGAGIDTPERVADALRGAGLDAEALIARASSDEAKALLRRNTDAALADGAFGVPTMIAAGELFWGVDALDALSDFLAGRDPVAASGLAKWMDVPASAKRPGS
jgi:2-hydroxychromene-2-carboxylate isomerase